MISPVARFVILAWLPVVLCIFALNHSARRAIIVSFITAWLFLPMASIHISGLPSYDKMAATCGGILLAAMVFDSRKLLSLSFCPSLVDLPMILWCICPLLTAMSNEPELTTHDGLSWTMQQAMTWGLPYLIGRIYFANRMALREMAIAIFVGGIIYMPLCLFEMRFSPSLHYMIYGYYQHSLAQQLRTNGFYRPMMFLEHGLAVGLYMANATLAGIWLWWTGALKKLGGVSIGWVLPLLAVTTVLCQSWGATFLFLGGLLCMACFRWRSSRVLLIALLVIPTIYVSTRTWMKWDGKGFDEVLLAVTDPSRTQSMMYRMGNEEEILKRAMERPWFGWGGYARAFQVRGVSIFDFIFTPDSLWINALGPWGWCGLGALLSLSLPLLFLRMPGQLYGSAEMSGVIIFAVLFALYQLDNMSNAMPNPLFVLGLGGLCGILKEGVARPVAAIASRSLLPASSRVPVMAVVGHA